MNIKFEIGCSYLTRAGHSVELISVSAAGLDFCFADGKLISTKMTGFVFNPSRTSDYDIVQRITPPNPDHLVNEEDVEKHAQLKSVLDEAFKQASCGKGKERHGQGLPFQDQRMQTISRLIDSDAGMEFQAIKKLTEGLDMADPEARERELLGVINYVAGIVVFHRNKGKLK